MKRLRLQFLGGPRRGDVTVFSASTVSLGRSRSNTLVLPEALAPAASGRHAEFVHDNGTWWLADLDSTNGTYLNGARVGKAALSAGDRVMLGDIELQVGFVDARPFWRTPVAMAAATLLVLIAGGGAVWWSRARAAAPERIAAAASQSVFLVALDGQDGRRSIGTAFAVGDGLLATNAHVADALGAALAAQGAALKALAVRSDGFDTYAVVAVRFHPAWRRGSIAHDVALLQLAEPVRAAALELADADEVRGLTRGVAVSSFGFPAVSTDPQRPRGRLSVDVLSDVRPPFFEVGLGIAPGTSGSPVFGPDGRVVGLVVSGDFERGAAGVPPHPTGSNVNWAVSVDELRPLLSAADGPSTP